MHSHSQHWTEVNVQLRATAAVFEVPTEDVGLRAGPDIVSVPNQPAVSL
jgi:hypothetical protein